jgi:hypothetical protein
MRDMEQAYRLNRWQIFFGSWALFTLALAPVMAGASVETMGGALLPALLNLVVYRKSASLLYAVAPGAVFCALIFAGQVYMHRP